jgi:hypothetical protein
MGKEPTDHSLALFSALRRSLRSSTEAAGDIHLDSLAVAILTFGSGLLGVYLQKQQTFDAINK